MLLNPQIELQELGRKGPAVSRMAMSLDSHVVDYGTSPGPGGLNAYQACVHACVRAQDPERRMEEKGLRCGHPPGE